MREMALRRDGAAFDRPPGIAGGTAGIAVEDRIVVISEDEQLRALLCELLVAHGYASVAGLDNRAASAASNQLARCEIAIVDASATDADVVRTFRRLKASSKASVVVIAASAWRSGNPDLEINGDVFVAKPFDPRELVFITRGVLHGRSRGPARSRDSLSVGPITLHTLLNTVTVAAREVDLTGVETRVLEELLVNASNPVARDRLSRCALGREWSPFDRCLDTHINRLRRKIGDDRRGRTPIRTVRGVGYLLLAAWEPRA